MLQLVSVRRIMLLLLLLEMLEMVLLRLLNRLLADAGVVHVQVGQISWIWHVARVAADVVLVLNERVVVLTLDGGRVLLNTDEVINKLLLLWVHLLLELLLLLLLVVLLLVMRLLLVGLMVEAARLIGAQLMAALQFHCGLVG